MAITKLYGSGGTFITLGSLDEDWYWNTATPHWSQFDKGIRVHSIQFVPGSWNDTCVIKDYNGSVSTSPIVFNSASLNRHETKYFHGAVIKPFYDVSDGGNDCAASANAKIIIHLGGYSL